MTHSHQDCSIEAKILARRLSAPRVLPEQIVELVSQLSFHTHVIPGTTVTIAAAIAPGNIVVALARSDDTGNASLDEAVGRKIAISRATDAARRHLWELESYRMKRNLLELHEIDGIDAVLDLAATLPDELAGVWAHTATPSVALHHIMSAGAASPEQSDPSPSAGL